VWQKITILGYHFKILKQLPDKFVHDTPKMFPTSTTPTIQVDLIKPFLHIKKDVPLENKKKVYQISYYSFVTQVIHVLLLICLRLQVPLQH
jgi:hypothetical protein